MCGLCIENKKIFPSEQKIYTKGEYDNHLKNGGEGGFEGHPKCEFCKRRYYDKDTLFFHLQKDHFTCHLCEKAGIRYRYYNDYDSLEEHFRKEHILCEERECLARKFTVFADPIDHAAHMMQFHPNVQVSRAIPVQFRSRREDKFGSEALDSTGGGGGFGRQNRGSAMRGGPSLEGGMGGRNVGGEWQVELPDAARDPREVIREQQRLSGASGNADEEFGKTAGLEYRPEDYPALRIDEAPDSNPLWVGRKNGQRSNNEQFPALPSGGGGPVVSGWGGAVKVSKKLSVVKPKQSNPKPAIAGTTKGSSVVGFHPPAPPAPPPKASQKPSSTPVNNPPKNVEPPRAPSAGVEELTLAEKIRISSQRAPPNPPPNQQPTRIASPAIVENTASMNWTPPPPTLVKDSPDDYPALPTAKKSVKSSSIPSWNSAGGGGGGKTGSGIYLVKPKSKVPSNDSKPAEPPPGFLLQDNDPPPGFFSPSVSATTNSQKKTKAELTESSNRKDFPGGWVSIGGSRDLTAQQASPVESPAVVVSESDFPTLPGGNTSNRNSQATGPSVPKKAKSKKQMQNELQSLAFKSK
jgi:hypothetical protein